MWAAIPLSCGQKVFVLQKSAPQFRKARNEMMLPDILFTHFLNHVGNLPSVKNNQRRFAPTPAHSTGIRSRDREVSAGGDQRLYFRRLPGRASTTGGGRPSRLRVR